MNKKKQKKTFGRFTFTQPFLQIHQEKLLLRYNSEPYLLNSCDLCLAWLTVGASLITHKRERYASTWNSCDDGKDDNSSK